MLTILIPTYNRVSHLDKLLKILTHEILKYNLNVSISVFNNASTDGTQHLLDTYAANYSFISSYTSERNIGSDANFLLATQSVITNYFWLLGDDDYPFPGIISAIVALLDSKTPDLVYLPSLWDSSAINYHFPHNTLFTSFQLPLSMYAKRTHVWTTFISSWIVNKSTLEQLSSSDPSCVIPREPYFTQLSWIYPLLSTQSKLYSFNKPCIVATAGNSGGYSLVNTFGVRFPRATKAFFGDSSPIGFIILNNFCKKYFWRILLNRYSSGFALMSTDSASIVPVVRSLYSCPWFWILCLPVLLAPPPLIIIFSRFLGLAKSLIYSSNTNSY